MTPPAKLRLALGAAWLCLGASPAHAQLPEDTEFNELLSMDIGDLVVTSVSKRPQRLEDTAAAVYVITQEDLHRTGITSIPDALRMAPGVDVAQVNAHSWAISIRGFNGTLANKILVLVDGRSVYTPVHGGTYWDDQFLPIEEIDHIEVVRGPGGSTWGANATNGVINIITKHTATTQGNFVSEDLGTDGLNDTVLQHGGKLSDDATYRAYGSYFHRGDSTNNYDAFSRERAGFRVDADRSDGNSFFLTGSAYNGNEDETETLTQRTFPFSHTDRNNNNSYGGDLLARWDHQFSASSNGTLQAYVDHYSRLEEVADQHITTIDLDWQHNWQTSERNHFSWGLGYRNIFAEIEPSFEARVASPQQDFSLFSAFAQDDYDIIPHKLLFSVGSKFEHDYFTGFNVQPTARLSWLVTENQTLWTSVSRAVRTPSIIEDQIDLVALVTAGPNYYELQGNGNLKPEDLTAYEIGYRFQPTPKLQVDLTGYLNEYRNLFTLEAFPSHPSMSGLTTIFPFVEENLGSGHVYGAEASATYRVTPAWKLMGSYTFGRASLGVDPASFTTLDTTEAEMPRQQFSIRSYWNVTPTLQWDNMLYYVDGVTAPANAYFRYDTRLGWHVLPDVEVSLVGQNLLEPRHAEFTSLPQGEIDRSLIGRVTWKF